MFEIGTYSDFILQNSTLIENYGGLFRGLQRATFLIFQNEFINNLFLGNSTAFTISIMSVGRISQCFFINQTGDSIGFLVSIFNALNEFIFEVTFIIINMKKIKNRTIQLKIAQY